MWDLLAVYSAALLFSGPKAFPGIKFQHRVGCLCSQVKEGEGERARFNALQKVELESFMNGRHRKPGARVRTRVTSRRQMFIADAYCPALPSPQQSISPC